jgi:uncharacterized caspase-like protein
MLRFGLILLVATVIGIANANGEPERRVALVIGNDTYPQLHDQLANAGADARGVAGLLEKNGFDVTVKTNVKRRELYQLIDAFGAKIMASPDTVGLFYYAGHGIQANGKNYLIPVDADLVSEADLEPETVDVGKVLRAMQEARNRVNIVLLDACRNNPLPKGRSLTRGLAKMDAPNGTFVGYAAAPGQTAMDGPPGGNGMFTGKLLKQIAERGLSIEEAFKRTIAEVRQNTHDRQVPWYESSLEGNFYFVGPTTVTIAPQPAIVDRDAIFWSSVKDSTSRVDFEAYLKQYPDGHFADLARNRLTALQLPSMSSTQAATSAPAPFSVAVQPEAAQPLWRRYR